jgi:hypothetical protein
MTRPCPHCKVRLPSTDELHLLIAKWHREREGCISTISVEVLVDKILALLQSEYQEER